MTFATANISGNFGLVLTDNGDDRLFPGDTGNVTCGDTNLPCYTTIPIFDIDESAKTATLVFHQKLPANLYSFSEVTRSC